MSNQITPEKFIGNSIRKWIINHQYPMPEDYGQSINVDRVYKYLGAEDAEELSSMSMEELAQNIDENNHRDHELWCNANAVAGKVFERIKYEENKRILPEGLADMADEIFEDAPEGLKRAIQDSLRQDGKGIMMFFQEAQDAMEEKHGGVGIIRFRVSLHCLLVQSSADEAEQFKDIVREKCNLSGWDYSETIDDFCLFMGQQFYELMGSHTKHRVEDMIDAGLENFHDIMQLMMMDASKDLKKLADEKGSTSHVVNLERFWEMFTELRDLTSQ